MHTSLNVTGRPAQFGRSLLPEVSGKLISQFASNLEAMITADSAGAGTAASTETAPAESTEAAPADSAGSAAATAASATAATPTPTQPSAVLPQHEDSLNLVKLAGVPVLKRVIPIAAGAALLAILGRRFRGVFRRSKA